MAKQANDENVRRDEDGPDYDAAIGLIRGQIRTNQSDVQSLAQDNSTLYKRIDKQHGVHRGAAKQFAAIDQMAPDKRTDFLRSLLGLLGHAGYDKFNDLVDQAQRPTPAKGKAEKAAKPAPGATDTDVQSPIDESLDPGEVQSQRQREADPMFEEGGNVHRHPAAGNTVN